MTALAIVGVLGLVGVLTFGIIAIVATRKAGRLDVALCKAQIQAALLESDLVASRQQRKDLTDAVIAAKNMARQFQEDLERAAHSLSRADLARLLSDVDRMLSFTEVASDPNGESDKVPSVGADVSGESGGTPEVP